MVKNTETDPSALLGLAVARPTEAKAYGLGVGLECRALFYNTKIADFNFEIKRVSIVHQKCKSTKMNGSATSSMI